MKFGSIIYLTPLALLACACTDEIEPNKPAQPGDEVKFCVSLGDDSRTAYGTPGETAFPVYWVDGDLIQVASHNCSVPKAQYKVNTNGSTTQNYATSLEKTGAAGLQWGTATEANFYAIYPGQQAITLPNPTLAYAPLSISSTQYSGLRPGTTPINGSYILEADMDNAIMYAQTFGVKSGENVDLRFIPYSTVLDIELNGPDTNVADQAASLYVQSVTLTAPDNQVIAGTFNLMYGSSGNPTPSLNAVHGTNSITVLTRRYSDSTGTGGVSFQLAKGEKMNVRMFLIPNGGTVDANWKLSVQTSAGTFSRTLGDVTNGTLQPGKIHQIKMPKFSSKEQWTYELDSWITSLPDYTNIYLSEVTLPGAWYATQSEYQGSSNNISTLYAAGVRAFGIETRCLTPRRSALSPTFPSASTEPTRVCVSGTGSGRENGAYSWEYLQPNNVVYISDVINQITGAISSDEYAVLVLSYAVGGNGGHRALDYNNYLRLLAEEISTHTSTASRAKIYQTAVTPETTINDVLGKLVIKVNVDNRFTTYTNYQGMPALLSFTTNEWSTTTMNTSLVSQMSWSAWDSGMLKNLGTEVSSLPAENLFWNYTNANRTSTGSTTGSNIPSMTNRWNSITTIIANSQTVYEASTHNMWFYVGAGGVIATNDKDDTNENAGADFAKEMNKWLLEQLQARLTAEVPAPLGIVMCNYINGDDATYYGPSIVKAIIEMNSVFGLSHKDPNAGTGGDQPSGQSNYASSSNIDPDNFNAFGPNQ